MNAFRKTLLGAAAALVTLGLPASAQVRRVILPADGAELNRRHVQFRWEQVSFPVSPYLLEIVVDNGAPDPFLNNPPVVRKSVSSAAPRTVITSGLEWGTDYAWRTFVIQGPVPGLRVTTPTRRFSTITPPIDDTSSDALPSFNLLATNPPAVQPGVVIWATIRRSGAIWGNVGYLVAVDEAGELIWVHSIDNANYGDIRMTPDGRITAIRNEGNVDIQGLGCSSGRVITLDGRTTWWSSTEYCFQDPFPVDHNGTPLGLGVHHELFPMPEDGPNGANFLFNEYDNRTIANYVDPWDGQSYPNRNWRGDMAVEYDRHTKDIVWSHSTFDFMTLDDHLPATHPSNLGGPGGNWNHTNALVYDPYFNRVLFSTRYQSRVTAIDYVTKAVVYRFGDDHILGFGPGGVGFGPWPSANDPLQPPILGMGGDPISLQHAPQPLPNGNVMVYDNGNFQEPFDPMNVLANRRTRAVEVAFDNPVAPTTASIVWQYTLVLEDLVTPAFARFVGDADRLPNGNTIVCDGEHSNIQEVDPAGNLVWFLDTGPNVFPGGGPQPGPGAIVYRMDKQPALIVDTPSDTDGDWDVDLLDLAELQVEFTGTNVAHAGFPASMSDHDKDGDVDADDFERFNYWMTAPGIIRN